jgi:anti-sigma regulatory factor (Ser/Thr protein kinase)
MNGERPERREFALPGSAVDARWARAEILRFLDGRLRDDRCDEVVLIVSELVTNAVVHARPPLTLRLVIDARRLRVEVEDGDSHEPTPRTPSAHGERGRGLSLVAGLCSRWGVRPAPSGKVVWCEVDR